MTGKAPRASHVTRGLLTTLLGLLVLGCPAPALSDDALPPARYNELTYRTGTHALLLTLNTDTPAAGVDIEHNVRLLDQDGSQLTYDEVVFEVHVQGTRSDLTLRGETLLHEETLEMLPTRESRATFTYPLSGPYMIRLAFRADGEDIAAGQFGMEVEEGTEAAASGGFPWFRFGLALLVGVLIGSVLPRGTRPRDAVEEPQPEQPQPEEPQPASS
ncbi:hypothetical protein EXE58_05645 [Nocardioides seonyuensis]|uniref:Copper resistance protein CopC n=1 Tax=Nocardioides seonyuensis TaxID=2518371 RepID=A0A4P7IG42_9ACTN|nr:hypothetical protein [Nocardioides seonyuensis]QBX54987.1 hypothetical protein EXE58_05645 [Nocardioides seonyuensis]